MNSIRYYVLFLLFLATFVIISTTLQPRSVFAETEQAGNEEQDSKNITTTISRVHPGLGAHKPAYVLFTWTSFDEGRKKEEIKFQISFKLRLYPWGELTNEHKRYKWYFGYTQKSFWQVFDASQSSPFRETNYNPELFLRTPEYLTKWGVWSIDGGYEHESNGQNIPASRSWDRLYIRPKLEKGIFSVDYKLWYRVEEDEKKDEYDTEGDDNPDIEDYYGNSELSFRIDFGKQKGRHEAHVGKLFHFDKSVINVMLRYNMEEEKGAVQADYFLPLISSMKLYFQYWNGYGESLIDYNKSFTKYGFGLAITN